MLVFFFTWYTRLQYPLSGSLGINLVLLSDYKKKVLNPYFNTFAVQNNSIVSCWLFQVAAEALDNYNTDSWRGDVMASQQNVLRFCDSMANLNFRSIFIEVRVAAV